MSAWLRTTFWLQAVLAAVFGGGCVFLPGFVAGLFALDTYDPFAARLYGVALIALGAASILAALAQHWQQVAIVLQAEVIFTFLSVLVCLHTIFFAGGPVTLWLAAALFAVLFVLFYCSYLQERVAQAREGRLKWR
jgi:hypothetical protein